MPTEKVKTENLAADEEVRLSDDHPVRNYQRIIKREHDSSEENQNEVRVSDDEMPMPKKVKTENRVPDHVDDLDGQAGDSQGRIKREPENDEDIAEAQHVPKSASSESEKDDELSPESSTVTSANLKIVFDVEYRAPE